MDEEVCGVSLLLSTATSVPLCLALPYSTRKIEENFTDFFIDWALF
jgi:predicted cation transporter